MTWPAVVENFGVLVLVAYLVGTGHSLWWLLLLAWLNFPKQPRESPTSINAVDPVDRVVAPGSTREKGI